ncbi:MULTISPECIES: MFS transporter [unclassified Sporosarcina]|uniref:MFS transporter n=1 Tax=unclassified Sporosarcina TaxID=2647733 RepID=UPI000C16932A|nr:MULTISPECIES: MFS transporter [unclassified Sporosarcina]PID05852.1 MFS transporter [Sporosarcina sp. P30]PID09046.1 MFS transporter [Sporosarcina sp. P31]PID12343.1 MFS transporter [Sporosarcina sp. P32b]
MGQRNTLWTKNFIVIFIINFILALVFFLLVSTIAVFSVETFHTSTSTAGLLSGIFVIGALIGRLGAGRIIQSAGSQKVLLTGLIGFLLTTGFYMLPTDFSLFFMNRFLHGVSFGFASTATGTIIAQIIPPSRRGEGIGYYSLSTILSTALGPLLGIWIISQTQNFFYVFIINFVLASVIFVLYFLVQAPVVEKTAGKEKLSISQYIELKAVPIAIVGMFLGFIYSSIMAFIPFFTKEIDLVEAGSFFFLVYASVVLLSRPFTGRLMDQHGANIIIYPCLVLFAFGMLIYSQAHYSFMVLLAAILIGFGYGSINSIAQAIAVKVTPIHRIGLATSTYFILFELGLGLGPFTYGFFIPHIGYRGIYLAAFFMILLSILLYYILHGRHERRLKAFN